jgi:non-canonical purine NTP pyrophosphatase (RdgB/HAM1 family)
VTEKLCLITNNELKFRNAHRVLKKFDIEVIQIEMDVPEIQSTSVKQIAEFSAKYAGDRLKTRLVKTDVAFEIRALNGFPGPFVKYVNQWLAPEKIIQLMENEKDRYAQFVDCITLYEPERQENTSFISITPGYIAEDISGLNGQGIDRIFIPEGRNKSLACYSEEEKEGIWDQIQWQQLAEYLHSGKNS